VTGLSKWAKRALGLRCSICNDPARPQIDLAIATGLSKRAIAKRFGLHATPYGAIAAAPDFWTAG
jgi:hypothetical protein